jgi:Xaa-Pro aminopeptidase
MQQSEKELVAGLLDAQEKAQTLFAETQARNLIRTGAKESEINEGIYALAESMFGISRYWHKRIVRAGRNTLAPYDENPPDLTVGEDDIIFLDFGPVFEEWEADFGRTYVVGNDPLKHKLCRDIEEAFVRGKQYFHEHPEITAAELYAHAQKHPKNPNRMRVPDASGRERHWILEIHFVDRTREIGGFYEQLLTIG